MALPKSVQKKIDEANRLVEEINKPAGEPPAGDPPVAGEPPAAPPAGEPPVAAPSNVTPLPDEGDGHRYKVLQGKYNAEVPRLQAKVRDQDEAMRQMREQLTATQNLLASLSAQRVSAPAAAPEPPVASTRLVTADEEREFGSDLIDVVRRVAREEQSTLMPQVDNKVRATQQRIEEVANQAAGAAQKVALNDRQKTVDYLYEKIPNAAEVNKMPEFLEWLAQTDPFSNEERGKLLSQAFQSFDGPRVVAFFQGFLKEHATVTRQPPPAADGQPPPAPQRKLDDLVAPGAPKPGAARTQDGSGKRVWSRAEITQFYRDKAVKYRGRMQEAAAIEADIFAAQREGRIR